MFKAKTISSIYKDKPAAVYSVEMMPDQCHFADLQTWKPIPMHEGTCGKIQQMRQVELGSSQGCRQVTDEAAVSKLSPVSSVD